MRDSRLAPRTQQPVDVAHEWKQLTLHANTLFEHGALEAAIDAYRRARELALDHFNLWHDADDAVTALVVSCLNLSESLARARRTAEAAAVLCSAHGGMLRAAGDLRLPPAVRLAAKGRLRETHAALLRFQATYGERTDIARWLHQGCACCGHAPQDAGREGGVPEQHSTLH